MNVDKSIPHWYLPLVKTTEPLDFVGIPFAPEPRTDAALTLALWERETNAKLAARRLAEQLGELFMPDYKDDFTYHKG